MRTEKITKTIDDILKSFAPIFKQHGGGAEVVSASETLVTLRILGHCNGCAMAPLTFGLGIEKMIRDKIPSIKEVRYTQ